MIATSEQAVEALRHKRTGEVLPTKKVERNTRLVYYADELVALRFHQTDIARYTPNGVVLDTRDNPDDPSPHGEGWFTITTWARIDEFTPARTHVHRGIRYVRDRLYVPGIFVHPDGTIESPIEPEMDEAIERILRTYPQRLRRHADKIVEAWAKWANPLPCCRSAEVWQLHYLDHFEANEPAVPTFVANAAASLGRESWGERLRENLRKTTREQLKPLIQYAIKRTMPDFPYPQLTKARTA